MTDNGSGAKVSGMIRRSHFFTWRSKVTLPAEINLNQHLYMSSLQKPFAIGGIGAQPTLDDVVRVAHGQIVSLDPAGADRVKKLSPPPKQFQAETWSDASSPQGLPLKATQIRAIVAAKILALMNGRSGVRLQVCEFLSEVRHRPMRLMWRSHACACFTHHARTMPCNPAVSSAGDRIPAPRSCSTAACYPPCAHATTTFQCSGSWQMHATVPE